MSEQRTVYEEKAQAQLDAWNAEIAKIQAKARESRADARIEYDKRLADLKAKRDAMRTKLDELRKSSTEAWQDFKNGVDLAWESLGEAMKSAKDRFR